LSAIYYFIIIFNFSWDSKYVLENKSFEEMGDVGEVWFGENAMLRMVRWLESHVSPDSSIIDLGCGNGLLSIELFEAGFKDVTGVDYSESAIQLANKVAEQRGIFGINFTV
jgi:2-polyprenyl-3-methyl-5-hydroxy-6-metoxy-1,4-benzoquinol methylase